MKYNILWYKGSLDIIIILCKNWLAWPRTTQLVLIIIIFDGVKSKKIFIWLFVVVIRGRLLRYWFSSTAVILRLNRFSARAIYSFITVWSFFFYVRILLLFSNRYYRSIFFLVFFIIYNKRGKQFFDKIVYFLRVLLYVDGVKKKKNLQEKVNSIFLLLFNKID